MCHTRTSFFDQIETYFDISLDNRSYPLVDKTNFYIPTDEDQIVASFQNRHYKFSLNAGMHHSLPYIQSSQRSIQAPAQTQSTDRFSVHRREKTFDPPSSWVLDRLRTSRSTSRTPSRWWFFWLIYKLASLLESEISLY